MTPLQELLTKLKQVNVSKKQKYNVDHLHRLVLILNLVSLQRKDMQVKKHSGLLHEETQGSVT